MGDTFKTKTKTMTEDKTQTPDLSEKIIDNPSDPYGMKSAMDEAYNIGITHCISLVTTQRDIEPSYSTQKDILTNLINSLNSLKKK